MAPVNPGIDNHYDWPSPSKIKKAQQNSPEKPPKSFRTNPDGIIRNKNIVWISPVDLLKLRIIVAAHSGIGGHRGVDATKNGREETHLLERD